jgi:SAM-dependent methyltransferase
LARPTSESGLTAERPYSEACERNRAPILDVLKRIFADRKVVLEIGSGTGQHAASFAPQLPHLVWQPSDVPENLPGIRAWVAHSGAVNLKQPIALDMDDEAWPEVVADAVFSANTAHIMSWPQVEKFVAGVGRLLPTGGVFCLYGPFNRAGDFTSDSNRRFDDMLRARDPQSGLRGREDIVRLAAVAGMTQIEDIAMPSNNSILVFRRA